MRVATFAAGLAVGYMLGTRAGRGRYEQLIAHARQLRANPTLDQLRAAVADLTGGPRPTHAARAATPPDAALGGTGTASPPHPDARGFRPPEDQSGGPPMPWPTPGRTPTVVKTWSRAVIREIRSSRSCGTTSVSALPASSRRRLSAPTKTLSVVEPRKPVPVRSTVSAVTLSSRRACRNCRSSGCWRRRVPRSPPQGADRTTPRRTDDDA